jgi:hypothetical protein
MITRYFRTPQQCKSIGMQQLTPSKPIRGHKTNNCKMTSGRKFNLDATTFQYETHLIPDSSIPQQTKITQASLLTPTDSQQLPRPSELSVSQARRQTRMTEFFQKVPRRPQVMFQQIVEKSTPPQNQKASKGWRKALRGKLLRYSVQTDSTQ